MAKNTKKMSGCRSAPSRTKPQDWVHMGEVCIFGLGTKPQDCSGSENVTRVIYTFATKKDKVDSLGLGKHEAQSRSNIYSLTPMEPVTMQGLQTSPPHFEKLPK